MNSITLVDKLDVVIKLTSSNAFYQIALIALIFLSFLLIMTNKKNKKDSIKTFLTIYFLVFLVIIIKYRSSLSTMFDYFMDNVFIIFYFPNIAVYFLSIIVTNIVTLISVFSRKTKKNIKVINSIIFCIINYLLIIILNIINTKKLDVFDVTSLYENKNIHTIIELSSNIFIIWIIFLILYKIIVIYLEKDKEEIEEKVIIKELPSSINKLKAPNKVIRRETKTEVKIVEKENEILSKIRRVNAPFTIKREIPRTEIIYKKPTNGLLSFIEITDAPIKINREMTRIEKVVMNNGLINLIKMKQAPIKVNREMTKIIKVPEKVKTNEMLDFIKTKNAPLKVQKVSTKKEIVYKDYNKEIESFDNLFTLEDYKLLSSLLKEQRVKEDMKKKATTDLMSLYE